MRILALRRQGWNRKYVQKKAGGDDDDFRFVEGLYAVFDFGICTVYTISEIGLLFL